MNFNMLQYELEETLVVHKCKKKIAVWVIAKRRDRTPKFCVFHLNNFTIYAV